MTVNRFETIRRLLHLNNNEKHFQREHPQHDRLHKIRPIISHLNEKFASVPMEQRLSIDEQMCATKEYNAYMGGVDLIDTFIGRYRIGMRSRKWYLRIFYHSLDMTVINSWLVYKYLKRNEAPSSILNLCHYRLELTEVLANGNNAAVFCNKRGKPSISNSVEMELQAKKRRGPVQHVPPKDKRTDNVGHWPDDCVRSRAQAPSGVFVEPSISDYCLCERHTRRAPDRTSSLGPSIADVIYELDWFKTKSIGALIGSS
ncbi:Chimeric ERCC6-PGBD3 protein [Eumeta japonica]|uniref:Chimeric ERCC6-PGBD3 protein n=1 Tax=Eumeta variegata TaxID=151549 RepID=A0A4C1VZ09_EUMVA|nr:Chimeric ERCC6-PGBD3 protein [Eumeta japonica]